MWDQINAFFSLNKVFHIEYAGRVEIFLSLVEVKGQLEKSGFH